MTREVCEDECPLTEQCSFCNLFREVSETGLYLFFRFVFVEIHVDQSDVEALSKTCGDVCICLCGRQVLTQSRLATINHPCSRVVFLMKDQSYHRVELSMISAAHNDLLVSRLATIRHYFFNYYSWK